MKSALFYDIQRRPSSKRSQQQSSASASHYRPFVSALRPSSFNPPIDTQPKRRRITAAASQAVKKVVSERRPMVSSHSDKMQNRYGPESNGNLLPNISEMLAKTFNGCGPSSTTATTTTSHPATKHYNKNSVVVSCFFGGDGLAPEMRVGGISKWPVDMSRHSSSGLALIDDGHQPDAVRFFQEHGRHLLRFCSITGGFSESWGQANGHVKEGPNLSTL